jgi:hypothetical protein
MVRVTVGRHPTRRADRAPGRVQAGELSDSRRTQRPGFSFHGSDKSVRPGSAATASRFRLPADAGCLDQARTATTSGEWASPDCFRERKSEPGVIAEQDGPTQPASKRMGGRLTSLSNLHASCRRAVACEQPTGPAVDAGASPLSGEMSLRGAGTLYRSAHGHSTAWPSRWRARPPMAKGEIGGPSRRAKRVFVEILQVLVAADVTALATPSGATVIC